MISENMLNKFFRKTAEHLADNGNIQEKYIDLYAKAMEAAVAIIINVVTALLIGYGLGMWWHCIIFLAAFIPLRSYAGGYHANGYVSCYLASCLLLAASLCFVKLCLLEGCMVLGTWQLLWISILVIACFVPLADKNKPLSPKETKVFRMRARIILCVESLLIGILAWMRNAFVYSVMMAIIVSAIVVAIQVVGEHIEAIRMQDEDE